jgi:hypothetical protein
MRFVLPAAGLAVALLIGRADAQLITVPNATSAFETGKRLLSFCNSPPLANLCQGYVEGVADAMDIAQAAKASVGGWTQCMPNNGMPSLQAQEIVVAFLRRHPEMLDNAAGALVAQALHEAFPCRPVTVPAYPAVAPGYQG